MFEITEKEISWGGRILRLETGRMARQADGAVLASYGETSVLATVVSGRTPRTDLDFFPLTVNYQEKYFASGRIPGGFFKREGRPTEKETLTSRLIDRPIRPLFFKGFCNETQIIATTLSHDLENDPDIVAMIAVSAALTISGIPFKGPIAAARVGYDEDGYLLNPSMEKLSKSMLDLVVAGTEESVMMVESEAQELSEETMLEAVMFAHREMQPVIDMIIDLAETAAKPPWPLPEEADSQIHEKINQRIRDDLQKAYTITDKQERRQNIDSIREKLFLQLAAEEGEDFAQSEAKSAFSHIEREIMRQGILQSEQRPDGRDATTIRPIACTSGILPRTHGSALFTRGETQALCVVTLGTGDDEQMIDALEGERRERFLLHYNFPPYSVGETGRMGGPGRREIGHGKLAWRALRRVLPENTQFPYTIRLVSEITESNGSSSMATVCGASLAMLDAGVPIKAPVAGIAMGLILEAEKFSVLSDIIGDEDHLGDMDFKVAGTSTGITSLQMDIKIAGITETIMQQALAQARAGRMHILEKMQESSKGVQSMSRYAPRIETMQIAVSKIREVIGPGGAVIRAITAETGAKIDIQDTGAIKIASSNEEEIEAAKKRIHEIVAEPEIGAIYKGKVVKLMDFGAFVNFFGGRDGLVHVSQMADYRVDKPSDIVNEGDMVNVKLIGFDNRGKVRLSMKVVDQKTGQEIVSQSQEA